MRAIIINRNKQYFINEDYLLKVDFLKANVDDILYLDKILFLDHENKIFIGNPFVSEKSIVAKVISHIKDKKTLVLKFKRRKNYLKRYGHRQKYTLLKILRVESK